ncbi:hypothetical protein E2C01_057803 [Portunus trituberculatus]|uniref:Uncharacterized protein n=1 Tax=Portunus trituberculatus TaxID=210409 RepID=A0A5B7GTZ0_PORTR|nr:hypothetical protein [Portunus trituberculatus]
MAAPSPPSKPLLFLAFNAPYEKLFRQLCPPINNRVAHLSQLFPGSSALEHHSPRKIRRKATSSPNPKKHNFLPFKDKLELIRKCEASIAQCCCSTNGCP